ncbi:MAG: ferrochelatase, partial [Myxococcota bacterium]
LVNLGTPDSTAVGDVRRYLREFLSDPRVIDINPIARWLLLNLIILPFRPRQSAEAYRAVWTDRGSPLLFHGQDLAKLVDERLGGGHHVALAMRYGSPSIPDVIDKMLADGVERIVVVPLFPQYSSAATGSALDRVYQVAGEAWNVPSIDAVPAFYDHEAFIEAFATVARPHLASFRSDFVLFSYHGVPERHVQKSDRTGQHCLRKDDCCASIGPVNRYCYRAQCFATTRALVRALELSEDSYQTSFQSRLGKTPWIQPYTDELLPELVERGVRRLAVMCPAFVADCLETIEEIGIRAKEDWVAAGGEDLLLVPSLNSEPAWADAVVRLVKDASR